MKKTNITTAYWEETTQHPKSRGLGLGFSILISGFVSGTKEKRIEVCEKNFVGGEGGG